jgi:hypothetical protein
MRAKMGNKDKMAIAKEVMTKLIKELPDNVQVGLEVYGLPAAADGRLRRSPLNGSVRPHRELSAVGLMERLRNLVVSHP